jgi:hypothetical protein
MRPIHFLLAIALCISTIGASAADVDFELGPNSFEEPAVTPVDFNFAFKSYDHPLYEGLWPMTIAAFRTRDSQLDAPIQMEFDFPLPAAKESVFLLASKP